MAEALCVRVQARFGALELDVELTTLSTLAIVGPNGAGKTSLLRTVLGAQRPERGRIVLSERVLFDAAAGVELPIEDRGIGYVPQGYALLPHLNALDNVAFAVALRRPELTRTERYTRAATLLERFGAGAVATRRPALLSGGEQQRVAMARALGAEPRALLLDEPLAALDAAGRKQMRTVLAAQLEQLGLPTLLVTHDPLDAAALDAQVAVLEQGRIVQLGKCDELAAAPRSAFAAELALRLRAAAS